MFPQPIMLEDARARARREFDRYPQAQIVWIKIDDAKAAFGKDASGADIEMIEFVPAPRAEAVRRPALRPARGPAHRGPARDPGSGGGATGTLAGMK